MEVLKISLEADELDYVKAQPRGWVRNIIRRFMDTDGALTPEELIYLRDHGGTRGVIAIARGEKSVQVDPETGEVKEDS
jgi:hypothetical protein